MAKIKNPKPPKVNLDRPRTISSDYSDSVVSEDSDHLVPSQWKRFLILKGTDANQPLSKISPFAISKGVAGITGK